MKFFCIKESLQLRVIASLESQIELLQLEVESSVPDDEIKADYLEQIERISLIISEIENSPNFILST